MILQIAAGVVVAALALAVLIMPIRTMAVCVLMITYVVVFGG